MKKSIALAMLMVLTANIPLYAGEFPKAQRPSDIAGAWEGTSYGAYHRLVIHENGGGTFVSAGPGNNLVVHRIETLTFGSDPFDFVIKLTPTDKRGTAISFQGTLWISGTLLLFGPKAEKPMAEPPAISLLREDELRKSRDSVRGKSVELEQ